MELCECEVRPGGAAARVAATGSPLTRTITGDMDILFATSSVHRSHNLSHICTENAIYRCAPAAEEGVGLRAGAAAATVAGGAITWSLKSNLYEMAIIQGRETAIGGEIETRNG